MMEKLWRSLSGIVEISARLKKWKISVRSRAGPGDETLLEPAGLNIKFPYGKIATILQTRLFALGGSDEESG
jgi:hypothetical protein